MKNILRVCLALALISLITVFISSFAGDKRFVDVTVNTEKQTIVMVHSDSAGNRYGNFENVIHHFSKQGKTTTMVMNGGMFTPLFQPVGLYIENGRLITPLNTATGTGNFYLKPNGIFYITADNKAMISTTADYKDTGQAKYATQSGPMLLVNNEINPAFTKGSENRQIRNGVGITAKGKVIFSISNEKVNFYDFANHFKELDCVNALYLDGAISKMYCPSKKQMDITGDFGVIIAVVELP